MLLDEVAATRPGGDLLGPLNLSILSGSAVGLVGPTGAGREDLIEIIMGHLPLRSGQVMLAGREISHMTPETRIRAGLVRCRISQPLPSGSNLRQLLVMARLAVGKSPREFWRHGTSILPPDDQSELLAAVEAVGLRQELDRPLDSFDIEQSRLVHIAVAHMQRPQLLILERPFAGLVGRIRDRMCERILRFRDAGTAILVLDDCAPYLAEFCDQLVVMAHGRLIASGTPDDVGNDAAAIEAFTGKSVLA